MRAFKRFLSRYVLSMLSSARLLLMVATQARQNKSANKPDAELNNFEAVRSCSMLPVARSLTRSCRSSPRTVAKVRMTKSSRSALRKGRRPPRSGRRDEVRFSFSSLD